MKFNVIHIVLIALIGWNLWLTFSNDSDPAVPTIDYDLLDRMYEQRESDIAGHDTIIKAINTSITRDSLFIHNADRRTRDSLRNILNPR